ncbi:hypothetical protein M514_11556 [Trichuris suis]|uniref:Uncharacterized protein n=1 Tax=Trichuris suis TaxID=68888 RepID=A0A085NHU8_9BILA|nr:hypothetical protein M513_11556 [Trichuris suis]KFD69044.1 hypothetical protein M514_11556 [Trichuris suis]
MDTDRGNSTSKFFISLPALRLSLPLAPLDRTRKDRIKSNRHAAATAVPLPVGNESMTTTTTTGTQKLLWDHVMDEQLYLPADNGYLKSNRAAQ